MLQGTRADKPAPPGSAFDPVGDTDKLEGTDVYRQLNDARFRDRRFAGPANPSALQR